MEIPGTKSCIPKGFELDKALSEPIWSRLLLRTRPIWVNLILRRRTLGRCHKDDHSVQLRSPTRNKKN